MTLAVPHSQSAICFLMTIWSRRCWSPTGLRSRTGHQTAG